jgi:hypothetical protein
MRARGIVYSAHWYVRMSHALIVETSRGRERDRRNGSFYIFVCSINWLVFLTETCLLRGTDCSLNTTRGRFSLRSIKVLVIMSWRSTGTTLSSFCCVFLSGFPSWPSRSLDQALAYLWCPLPMVGLCDLFQQHTCWAVRQRQTNQWALLCLFSLGLICLLPFFVPNLHNTSWSIHCLNSPYTRLLVQFSL